MVLAFGTNLCFRTSLLAILTVRAVHAVLCLGTSLLAVLTVRTVLAVLCLGTSLLAVLTVRTTLLTTLLATFLAGLLIARTLLRTLSTQLQREEGCQEDNENTIDHRNKFVTWIKCETKSKRCYIIGRPMCIIGMLCIPPWPPMRSFDLLPSLLLPPKIFNL